MSVCSNTDLNPDLHRLHSATVSRPLLWWVYDSLWFLYYVFRGCI